jgi:hypothetical protein
LTPYLQGAPTGMKERDAWVHTVLSFLQDMNTARNQH